MIHTALEIGTKRNVLCGSRALAYVAVYGCHLLDDKGRKQETMNNEIVASLLGQLGIAGGLAWFLYYLITKQMPEQRALDRNAIAEQGKEDREAVAQLQENYKAMQEVDRDYFRQILDMVARKSQDEISALRDEIKALRVELEKHKELKA